MSSVNAYFLVKWYNLIKEQTKKEIKGKEIKGN